MGIEVFDKPYLESVTRSSVLEHVSRPVYIHFLDRELLTSLGAYVSLSESLVYEDLRLVVLSTYEPTYVSVSLIFENRFARSIFGQLLPLFQRGHIQVAMKDSSLRDFILSKREQYSHAKELYPFYFDDTWKHIAKYGPTYRHKELDTTNVIKDTLTSDLQANGAISSAKRLGIVIDQNEVVKLIPYTIEALELRGKRAITRLLFREPYEKLDASFATRRSFNIKVSENYVSAYLSEYDGTIATGLSSGIEYFHYLCPTFPFHHIPLWHQVNQRLGCLATIRSLTAEDIVTLRETPEFQSFVDEFRFFIARAIQTHYLTQLTAVPHHPTIIEYLERIIRANLHPSSGNLRGVDNYLCTLERATANLRSLDIGRVVRAVQQGRPQRVRNTPEQHATFTIPVASTPLALRPPEHDMSGIPNAIHNRLRETLLECSPFESNSQLRAVFTKDLLIPWRDQVPQGSSPSERVDIVINFLVKKRRADTKENALVIFLRVLSAQKDKADECHQRLSALADELDRELSATSPAPTSHLPSPSGRIADPSISTSSRQFPLELNMPEMGKPFLSKSDREWIISTVDTVIAAMSVDGIKNLLRRRLPDSSINRINYRDGTRNIAETIVGMLELRGGLNPPDYHALGAFLTEIAEADLVGYDAAVKIVALLFRYNLVKSRAQITELSSRFQVPSPVLSVQTYPGRSPSLLHLPVRLSPTEITERIESLYNHGIRYILDVNFLISGAKVANCVCRVEFDKRGEGTGFLVAPDLVLTNYHVMLPSEYKADPNVRAQRCGVRFGAIKDEEGGVRAGRYFKLHDKWLVAQSEPNDLDFMLIRLQRPVTAEDKISPLPLEPCSVQKDAFVNIIQHPNGGPMEVSLRFNQVVSVEDKRVYYLADTEEGSSGSPVFDDEWKVVALHRSGGELDVTGKLILEANAGVPIGVIRGKIAAHL